MKNFITLFLISLCLISGAAFAISNDSLNETIYNEKDLKSQMTKVKNRRIIISNALLLNEQQKKEAYNIYEQSSEKEAILYLNLKKENKLLENLSSDKSINRSEKTKQKKVVASLKKELKSVQKDYDKEFKQILNRSQKSKYRQLNREIPLL